MSESETVGPLIARVLGSDYRSVRLRFQGVRLAARAGAPQSSAPTLPGAEDAAPAPVELRSPAPGWVSGAAAVGTTVAAGDTVVTVRTHSGSHPVPAPFAGEVVAVLVTDDQFIGSGSALVSIARAL